METINFQNTGWMQQINAILMNEIADLPEDERIDAINAIRIALHEISPFKNEPVDCVIWVPGDSVFSNDYNPNKVAPPEMRLLETSIVEDGFTQPVVTWVEDGKREVIDGFHRNRVGQECSEIRQRIRGYLPVTTVNENRHDRGDRIASTIRHNRARGKHQISAMSDIVVELSRRNWSDVKIAKELGMDADEVLRLKQITGLAEMFADEEFSEAWEISE
jgi:ParB-like chromosome segregation protein Spo0J